MEKPVMNTKIPLKKSLLKLLRDLGTILLMAQMMYGCELEEIPPTNPNPRSSFEYLIQDAECIGNCTVTFTNTSDNADRYEWNFGDETAPSTLANPVHQYAVPGSYDVTLRAFRDTVDHDTTIAVVINHDPGTASNLQAFTHTANSGNVNNQLTTLDNALTNGISAKIIVVTPVLGLRNSAALGAYYFGNKWMIFTQNTSNMQPGEIFNVVVADPGANAFVHQTSAGNLRTGYSSTIDHSATNNNPDARVFATPVWEQSTDYNDHPIGVVYINNKWEIANLDKVNLPVGLKFHVIVSTDNARSFVHTSATSSITLDYTAFDDVKTNNKPNRKIFVMSNQGTSDAAFSNPRLTGVWYKSSASKWTVFNENGDEMQPDVRYNVLSID
jgi:PKD repeat protein